MNTYKVLLIGFVLGIVSTSAIQCSGAAPTEAGASPRNITDAGKYQISTSFREDRDGVFETIMDTETGVVTYEVLLIGFVLGIVSTTMTIFLVWISWVCDRRKKAKAKRRGR